MDILFFEVPHFAESVAMTSGHAAI